MFLEFIILFCVAVALLMRAMKYLLQKSLKGTVASKLERFALSVFLLSILISDPVDSACTGDVVLITGGASGIGYLVRDPY